MSKVYCGSKTKIPKGKKRGNIKQCMATKQIRYYGLNKIDNLKKMNLVTAKKKYKNISDFEKVPNIKIGKDGVGRGSYRSQPFFKDKKGKIYWYKYGNTKGRNIQLNKAIKNNN